MKKAETIITLVLTTVLALSLLIACGSNGGLPDGIYTPVAVTIPELGRIDAGDSLDVYGGYSITIDGNTFTTSVAGMSASAKYTYKDGTLTFDNTQGADASFDIVYRDNTLYWNIAGITLELQSNRSAGDGSVNNDGSTSDSDEGGDSAVPSGNMQESNLNLPLEGENITFLITDYMYYQTHYVHISGDGVLSFKEGVIKDFEGITLDDVRSVCSAVKISNEAFYAIKNDNSLWAVGNNRTGLVGDGTGVDRNEFVKIADDVAVVFQMQTSFLDDPAMCAIKTDKTLWRWGNEDPDGQNVFAPVKIEDNVVRYLGGNYFLCADGSVIDISHPFVWIGEDTVELGTGISNVADAYYIGYYTDSVDNNLHEYRDWYTLSDDGVFSLTTVDVNMASHEMNTTSSSITTDVKHMMVFGSRDRMDPTVLLLKIDGSLWGFGDNTLGQLGDGTKVNRNEPVHIADDVNAIGTHQSNVGGGSSYVMPYFIKKDGTPWTWTSEDPSPTQQTPGAVAAVLMTWQSGPPVVITHDGKYARIDDEGNFVSAIENYDSDKDWCENIMMPSAVTFG